MQIAKSLSRIDLSTHQNQRKIRVVLVALSLALAGASPCYAQIAQVPPSLSAQPAPPPERSRPGQGFNSPPAGQGFNVPSLGQGANMPPEAAVQTARPREPQVLEPRTIRPGQNDARGQGYNGQGYGGQTVIIAPVVPYGYGIPYGYYPGQLPPPQVTQPLAQAPVTPNCIQAAPGVTQQIFDASGAPIYCEYAQ